MTNIIATTSFTCRDTNGKRFPVRIEIGAPYQAPGGEWACAVSMDGWRQKLHPICGEDSFQALCLALTYVQKMLQHFVEDGGQIFHPGSKQEVDLEAIFGETEEAHLLRSPKNAQRLLAALHRAQARTLKPHE
jgi:hypothetical protein